MGVTAEAAAVAAGDEQGEDVDVVVHELHAVFCGFLAHQLTYHCCVHAWRWRRRMVNC